MMGNPSGFHTRLDKPIHLAWLLVLVVAVSTAAVAISATAVFLKYAWG